MSDFEALKALRRQYGFWRSWITLFNLSEGICYTLRQMDIPYNQYIRVRNLLYEQAHREKIVTYGFWWPAGKRVPRRRFLTRMIDALSPIDDPNGLQA